jgi:hypothetical protein
MERESWGLSPHLYLSPVSALPLVLLSRSVLFRKFTLTIMCLSFVLGCLVVHPILNIRIDAVLELRNKLCD